MKRRKVGFVKGAESCDSNSRVANRRRKISVNGAIYDCDPIRY